MYSIGVRPMILTFSIKIKSLIIFLITKLDKEKPMVKKINKKKRIIMNRFLNSFRC